MEQVNGNKLAPKKDKSNGSIKLKKAIVKKSEPKEGEGSGTLFFYRDDLFSKESHLTIL